MLTPSKLKIAEEVGRGTGRCATKQKLQSRTRAPQPEPSPGGVCLALGASHAEHLMRRHSCERCDLCGLRELDSGPRLSRARLGRSRGLLSSCEQGSQETSFHETSPHAP